MTIFVVLYVKAMFIYLEGNNMFKDIFENRNIFKKVREICGKEFTEIMR